MTQQSATRFRRFLRKLERETGLALSGETECCSVSVAQCHLLLELERLGSASLQELADALSLDKSTLSRTVETCVRLGFIARDGDGADRRRLSLCLTPVGREKCDVINGLCNGEFSDVFRHIPKGRHADVIESVALLADAMEKARKERKGAFCDR